VVGGAAVLLAVPAALGDCGCQLDCRAGRLWGGRCLLKPVAWSPGTKLGVLLLRGYLVVSIILLIVKAIQLGGG